MHTAECLKVTRMSGAVCFVRFGQLFDPFQSVRRDINKMGKESLVPRSPAAA